MQAHNYIEIRIEYCHIFVLYTSRNLSFKASVTAASHFPAVSLALLFSLSLPSGQTPSSAASQLSSGCHGYLWHQPEHGAHCSHLFVAREGRRRERSRWCRLVARATSLPWFLLSADGQWRCIAPRLNLSHDLRRPCPYRAALAFRSSVEMLN